MEALANADERFAQGIVMLWYPIKDLRAVDAFRREVARLGLPKTLCVELDFAQVRSLETMPARTCQTPEDLETWACRSTAAEWHTHAINHADSPNRRDLKVMGGLREMPKGDFIIASVNAEIDDEDAVMERRLPPVNNGDVLPV